MENTKSIIAALKDPEQLDLRKQLRIELEKAQANNRRDIERKIVQTLQFLFPNPCKNILDKHLRFRILNFLLQHILDDLLFWIPEKHNYSEIPLPHLSQQNKGKLFLGRMISQHELKMLYKVSPRGLFVLSLQIPEETYANDGGLLEIPFYNWKIIRGNCDIPEEMHDVSIVRFCDGGVYDHCFRNAETGKIVSYQEMLDFLQMINAALLAQKNVYVHCWAGKERSATLVICYLMLYGNLTLAHAAVHVKRYRNLAKSFHNLKCQQKIFLVKFFLKIINDDVDRLLNLTTTELAANIKLIISVLEMLKGSDREINSALCDCLIDFKKIINLLGQQQRLQELRENLSELYAKKLEGFCPI